MARKKSDTTPDEFDDRRLLDKVTQGDMKNFDTADIVDAAGSVGNLIPGPVGQMIDAPVSAIAGELKAEKEETAYRKRFGDLDKMSHRSHGVRRKLEELRTRWRGRFGEAATSGVGALGGGALVGAMASGLAGPVGWAAGLAGAAGGWFTANKIYNGAFPRADQNALRMVSQIDKAQKAGEEVPQEAVFAAVAANLPSSELRRLEDKLERATGTRNIMEAMADPANSRAVTRIMQSEDTVIRASNPDMLGVGEYTALINSGRMQAKDLLDPMDYAVRRMHARQQEAAVAAAVPPSMPEVRAVARDMAASGVAPGGNEDGNPHLLPTRPGQNQLG